MIPAGITDAGYNCVARRGKETAPGMTGTVLSLIVVRLARRRSWGRFAFLPFSFLAATLLPALWAILSALRRSLGLNLLAMFATAATRLLSALPALLAVLSPLPLGLTLGLKLLLTFAAAASPTADILRPGLISFFMAVSLMLTAFGRALVFQIRIWILRSHWTARTRRLFAVFTLPFVLSFTLFKGFGRTLSRRGTGFILECLASVLPFAR